MSAYPKSLLARYLLATAVVGAILLIASGLLYDRNMVEKQITRIILPIGLLWIGLLLNMLYAWAQSGRFHRSSATLLFFAYWIFGGSWFTDRVAGMLESRYLPIDPPSAERYDALIVLGGGTSSNERGDVWLGFQGDRVMLAARLYHEGRVDRLLATGQAQGWMQGKKLDPSQATLRIWRELGIPEQKIATLPGINTSREMQAIEEYLRQNPLERVGILTSAFHLPRAQRLARRHNLDLVPVPSAFLSPVNEPLPLAILPSASAFQTLDYAAREYLAALVSR
jgi:uncharacterized SAM-binding protein YcdF (DUF218 family)